ncbi:MAG: hypothetical protein JO112_21515, partial [Planctomycetes bacterium]|nr:hypothetical protein [Planctomycetota bacterium]
MRDVKHWFRRYRVALFAPLVAYCGTLLLPPHSEQAAFGLYVAATLISALRSGLGPGILATALSAGFLTWQQCFNSSGGPPVVPADFPPRLAMFGLVGFLAGYLSRECKRAVQAVSWLHDSLSVLGDAVILTDDKGKVTFLNPAAHLL